MIPRPWLGWLLLLAFTPFALTLLFGTVPPVSSIMLQSFLSGGGMWRDWVHIGRISPHVIDAVLAAEDGRFCGHNGIDWEAVDATRARNERSRRLHGASTITMQVAKNLYLWNGRNWLRKSLEAPIALWIDFVWPKQRILEVYLNIAQWGRGIFGIEKAAQLYFKKPAAKLTRREAALLAAALPDPLSRTPSNPSGYQASLADRIELRMAQAPDIAACIRRRLR